MKLVLFGLFLVYFVNGSAAEIAGDRRLNRIVKTPSKLEKAHPIVLIPGVVGSQLFAKLNRSTGPHVFCYKHTSDWYQVWLNVVELIPEVIDCLFDDMKLVYNNCTRTTHNQPGVDIKVPGAFGDTVAIDYLSSEIPRIAYFHNFIATALLRGYKYNSTLLGAAYDWRKAPNEQQAYFENLQGMIEKAYAQNGKSAAIFCHSMGCLYTLYFLNKQSQSWKDKYVRTLIAMGGPWGGAAAAVQAFAIGYNFGITVYSGSRFLEAERTFPSTAFLMPKKQVFAENQFFIQTPRKNYSVANYKELFEDYGQPLFYELWKDSYSMGSDLVHPGVDVFCIHGINMTTVEQLVYPDMKHFPEKPKIMYGDGDGTVNLQSLEACKRWASNKHHNFLYYKAPHGDHVYMVGDLKLVDMILNYIDKL